MVRRLGPGLPHDPFAGSIPTSPKQQLLLLPARMVHAPQRPDPGLRVRLRRRQSARPRLGLLARLQDRPEPQRQAATALPRPRLPEAAHELHLVGQPQGCPQASNIFAGGFLGLDNIGVFDRSQAAAHWRRTSRTGRRNGLDGLLLRHHAVDGPRAGAARFRLRRHRVQVLRTLRRHRRRHEHARRQRAMGRTGRLLLRPAQAQRRLQRPHSHESPLHGRPHPPVRRRLPRTGGDRQRSRLQTPHGVVHRSSPRSVRQYRFHDPPWRRRAPPPLDRPEGPPPPRHRPHAR